ncbi:MAG: spore coat protein, partial [Oscillospiraceae bacterium]|nr:spore coat protein [Oscillospiraceae bacterium]
MDDKMIMEDLLTAVKTGADLYLHGTIESGTANVHGA